MSIAAYDDAINEATVTRGTAFQALRINKIPTVAPTSSAPTSWWRATGMPSQGSATTTGKANGRVCTAATAGAIPITNPGAGTNMYLTGLSLLGVSGSPLGYAILVDRIADVTLDGNEATGAITGLDATSRLRPTSGAGDGAMLWAEVATPLSATDYQCTLTYTNERGIASKVTQNLTGSVGTENRNPFAQAGPFIGNLAAGDVGVRSVQSITRNAGSATGTWNLCLVKPLAYIGFLPNQNLAEQDYLIELPGPRRIYTDACLMLITTIATTTALSGEVRIICK